MEKDTEEISLVEQEVARRLDVIINNKAVQDFIQDVKEDAENSGMVVKFKSRIKENESAINKFRKYKEQSGIEDPEMWDSCGMMVIVQDIEEIYEFVKFFEEKLDVRENGLSDYVQNPKDGYRSIHIYSTFEADGITVPSEIQIKTEAMAIAQDTIHDNIYKLESMPYEQRSQLSAAMFPIFEKSQDAEKFEKRGDKEQAQQLRSEVKQQKEDNAQLLADNQETVNNLYKEYGKVLFTYHNADDIDYKLLMKKPNMTKVQRSEFDKKVQNSLDYVFAYYQENTNTTINVPTVSGDYGIDYAIYKLSNMKYDDLVREVNNIKQLKTQSSEKQESVAGMLDFEQMDLMTSAEERRDMIEKIKSERQQTKEIEMEDVRE